MFPFKNIGDISSVSKSLILDEKMNVKQFVSKKSREFIFFKF
jgi:hypothetical protein